ncbi:MAG: glycosyltransferase family 2 protein, partial [Minisyncoccia bacterium]
PLNYESNVVLHPNSPKSLEGKLEVFQKILGTQEMRKLHLRQIAYSHKAAPHSLPKEYRDKYKWKVWSPKTHPLPKSPDMFWSISFCITCMGRTHDLKETLLQNIRDNEEYPHLEFVVLNYNSKDDMHSFMTSKDMRSYIKSGRVKYMRTRLPEYYSSAHSHNIAFKHASGAIVASVDADNYTGKNFAAYLNRLANICPRQAFFVRGKMRIHGRIGMYKAEFEELGGYDEDLRGYGFDDHSLMLRAMNAGCTLMWWARGSEVEFAKRIVTPRSRVAENMENPNWRETESLNKVVTFEKLERGELVVNVNKDWGFVKDLEIFA